MAERVNESQIKHIINYMTRNKNILSVICVGPKSEEILKMKWAQLAKELNSLGPPVKTVLQWQKVWRYLRNIAIMKTIRNRSRVPTKKISSLIPQILISGVGGQDGVPIVKQKRKLRVYKSSEMSKFDLPAIIKGKRTIEKRKLPPMDFPRKNVKAVLRKYPTALQRLSFSLNVLP